MGHKTRVSNSYRIGLEHLATPKGSEELLNNFVETNTLVFLGKKPIGVTTQLIKAALGMRYEGVTKKERNYSVVEEITKKGLMHQVKDVPDANRRTQF